MVRRVLFSRVTKRFRKRYLTVLLHLLSKLDASIRFVQVFVEFIEFVFVHISDRFVNSREPERESFTVSC